MNGIGKSHTLLRLMLAIGGAILAWQQTLSTATAQTAGVPPAVTMEIVGPTVMDHPIRASVNFVLFNVRVLDTSGRTVNGLARDSFRIFENRIPQQLQYFSSEDAPISVGLILDVSGSMQKKIGNARLAVSQFLRTANPRDEFCLITFGDRPQMLSEFTNDRELLVSKVNQAMPHGDTALIDAIHVGLQEMMTKATYDRRVLLVISDGGDNHSRYTVRDIQRETKEEEVQIFSIGIFSAGMNGGDLLNNIICSTCESEREGRSFLTSLSQTAGGRFIASKGSEELPNIVDDLGRIMHSVYVLGYTSSNHTHDGKWRQTEVRVTSEDHRKYRVLNRAGYYAPSE